MTEPTPEPTTGPRTAVVTIAHGRHEHLALQQRSLSIAHPPPDDYVVVAMQDDDLIGWAPERGVEPHVVPLSADPDALPLAAARNVGALAALGRGADVLVFLDVDCLAGDDLVVSYAQAARERRDVLWCGPVTYLPQPPEEGYDLSLLDTMDAPHPARPAPAPGTSQLGGDPDLFWSLSFALHRSAWASVGGFCEEYVGYGGEDTDFAQLAVAAGVDLGWLGGARAYHQHHGASGPAPGHVEDILRNGRLFRERWGRWPMRGWLDDLADQGLVEQRGDDWVRTTAR